MSNLSSKSITPLILEPGPSLRVRVITLCGFLLALASIFILPFPSVIIIAAIIIFIPVFTFAWRHHPVLSGEAVTVHLDSDGHWHWQQGEKRERVELLGDSYHVSFLVILNFSLQGKGRRISSLLLTRDNIDADTFRRLRAHLNWQEESAKS